MAKSGNRTSEWQICEEIFDPQKVQYYETIFTLGNGYLGTRGSLEEGAKDSQPATLLAGIYDQVPGGVTEIPNAPNWLVIRPYVEDKLLSLNETKILDFKRILDVKRGLLSRWTRMERPDGKITSLKSIRFVSVDNVHLMGIKYTVKPENYDAKIKFECSLDGNITNGGVIHFDLVEIGKSKDVYYLKQKTRQSNISITEAATVCVYSGDEEIPFSVAYRENESEIICTIEFNVQQDREYTIAKIVSIFTSRDTDNTFTAAVECVKKAAKEGFDDLMDAHVRVWGKRWQNSDIKIQGDNFAQQAVRFSIFHLLQAVREGDERVSIPAKALSGFGYKGHVFWDTDIFILPFFCYTNPQIAKNLLMYRYHTMDGARKKAQEMGYKGAMFAWESADTGEETTPKWGGKSDQKVRIWCGDSEHHIVADVAYATWFYYRVSGDEEFLVRYGVEIILETARFWVSRVEYNARRDRYEINRVIGPDEYHENIDNNAFTNAMAQWNINTALDIIKLMMHKHLTIWQNLKIKLMLKDNELRKWQEIVEKMYIPYPEDTKILSQFDGFMDLDEIDTNELKSSTSPTDITLGREIIVRSKILKQPDVLMLIYLLDENYSLKFKKANFDFYEPLCSNGSSLSPGIHSIVASRVGYCDKAYEYFRKAALVDLQDYMSNVHHGLHAAAMGSLLQAVIRGFAGLKVGKKGFSLSPQLPKKWKSLELNLVLQGNPIRIQIKSPVSPRNNCLF